MSGNPCSYHPGGSATIGTKGKLSVKKNGGLVVFVLDKSGSMSGTAIQNLNAAVNRFAGEIIKRDGSLSTSIEMEVIAFNSNPTVALKWTSLGAFQKGSVRLSADDGTTIGTALDLAFSELKQKEQATDRSIFTKFVSYIVLISDGAGGSVDSQAQKIKELTQQGGFKFWMLGVTGYDKPTAEKLTAAGPERLYTLDDGEKFDFTPFFNDLIGDITGPGPGPGPGPGVKRNKTIFRIG